MNRAVTVTSKSAQEKQDMRNRVQVSGENKQNKMHIDHQQSHDEYVLCLA